MRLEGTDRSQQNARRLRKAMTPPEIDLWMALRRDEAGLRFRRQYAAGAYVLDFYCAPARLAIEVDGEAHNRGDRPVRDARRDAWLAARSTRVLRYPASDVLSNLEGVVREIMGVALERRGNPELIAVLPLRQAAPATSPWAGEVAGTDPTSPARGRWQAQATEGTDWHRRLGRVRTFRPIFLPVCDLILVWIGANSCHSVTASRGGRWTGSIAANS